MFVITLGFQYWDGYQWTYVKADAKRYATATSQTTQEAVEKAKASVVETDRRRLSLSVATSDL